MSHVYDTYHYYVENGQLGVLEKYDDWYPADDRYTNVRFSIEDEAGTILFDNHRTGDVPVTPWTIPRRTASTGRGTSTTR